MKDFKQTKLTPEEAANFRFCAVATVAPNTLLLMPAYVYMKLNQKFVMIKQAMDIFSEEDLEHLKTFGVFYFPEEIDQALRFREVASEVRRLLDWQPERDQSDGGRIRRELRTYVTPASFEVADTVLRLVAPLWEGGVKIDPYFVAVFTNELCDSLDPALLKKSRNQNIALYEKAIVASSWAVFLALHLGYLDTQFLNRLRLSSFEEIMSVRPVVRASIEVSELVASAYRSLGAALGTAFSAVPGTTVSSSIITQGQGRTAERLNSRFKRMEEFARV
jgi:hypothetical protein